MLPICVLQGLIFYKLQIGWANKGSYTWRKCLNCNWTHIGPNNTIFRCAFIKVIFYSSHKFPFISLFPLLILLKCMIKHNKYICKKNLNPKPDVLCLHCALQPKLATSWKARLQRIGAVNEIILFVNNNTRKLYYFQS